jgi:hypothetical protein
MTFLLLLVSVAVLEYILRKPEDTGAGRQYHEKTVIMAGRPDGEGVGSKGLIALIQAVEEEGCGTAPSSTSDVRAKPLDRV